MSASEALGTSLFYYTVSLYDIPFELPLNIIAESIVPREDNEKIGFLKKKHNVDVIPHQLQVFKEPLQTKFGYVTYAAPCAADASSETHEVVQKMLLRWIQTDLVAQLAVIKCKCQLAQPKECYSSLDFIASVEKQCEIFKKVGDTTKFRAFLLSKITFVPSEEALAKNTAWVQGHASNAPSTSTTGSATRPLQTWEKPCAELSLASLQPLEVLWLKKTVEHAPPILMTNKDIKTTHMDKSMWRSFLGSGLAPLINVTQ